MRFCIICIILWAANISAFAQSITEYQQIAAENNPALKAEYKTYEAAMQKVTQQGSLADPTLSFGYFLSPIETRVGPQQATLSLTQMFPWFGTLKASKKAAAFNAESAYQRFLDAKNRLYYDVANAYYPLYELARLKEIEQENLKILSTFKQIAIIKYENAEGALADVLRVKLMINKSQTDLSILAQKQKPLRIAFNKLLNRDDTIEVLVPDTIFIKSQLLEPTISKDNPLIEALDLKVKASEEQVLLAKKQGLPKIGLGLNYVVVNERTDMVPANNGRDAIMPMLTLGLPINRKKYNAATKEAELRKEGFELLKESQLNQLQAGYERTLFEQEQQAALINLYGKQIKEINSIVKLLLSAYSNDKAEIEEILSLQQQLLDYRKLRISATARLQVLLAERTYLTASNDLKE